MKKNAKNEPVSKNTKFQLFAAFLNFFSTIFKFFD